MTAPLCKDCRWYERWMDAYPAVGDLCRSSILLKQDLVTGPYIRTMRCSVMRQEGPCGPEGKLFEPRRPWWRLLKGGER